MLNAKLLGTLLVSGHPRRSDNHQAGTEMVWFKTVVCATNSKRLLTERFSRMFVPDWLVQKQANHS